MGEPLRVDLDLSPSDEEYKVDEIDSKGREMSDPETVDYELPLATREDPRDSNLDTDFGTLDDLISARPEMSVLYIPELKKNFYIRTLTGLEVDAYRTSITVGKGQNQSVNQRGMRAKLAVIALGNPDGTRMLTDKDIPMVQSWPSRILERIFDRARKFNGLTDEDTDEEKGNS